MNRYIVKQKPEPIYRNPRTILDWIIIGLGSSTPSLLNRLSGNTLVIDAGYPELVRSPGYSFATNFTGADQYLSYANVDGKLSPLTCGIGWGGTSRVNVGTFSGWSVKDLEQIQSETGFTFPQIQIFADQYRSHLDILQAVRTNTFSGPWITSLISDLRSSFNIRGTGVYEEEYMEPATYYLQDANGDRLVSTDIYPVRQPVLSGHRVNEIKLNPDGTWNVDGHSSRRVVVSEGYNTIPLFHKMGWIPGREFRSHNHYGLFIVFQIDQGQIPGNLVPGDYGVLGGGIFNYPELGSGRNVELLVIPSKFIGVPLQGEQGTASYAIVIWLLDRLNRDKTSISETGQMRYHGDYLVGKEREILFKLQDQVEEVLLRTGGSYRYRTLWKPREFVYDTYHQGGATSSYVREGQIRPGVFVVDYTSMTNPLRSHPVAPLMVRGLAWGERLNQL